MAKQVDSTNIGTLLESLFTKIKSFFWRKDETSQLAIDNTPTSGSNNLVKSGGVHTALSGKVDKASNANDGDLAVLDANGNIKNAGLDPLGIALFPNMDGLTPIQTIEYDLTKNEWCKLFERVNPEGTEASDVSEIISCRVTVTGDNMTEPQVIDLVAMGPGRLGRQFFAAIRALTPDVSNAAKFGLYQIRNSCPKALGSGYGWVVDFNPYYANRHLKIEVFKTAPTVVFFTEHTKSNVSSTYYSVPNSVSVDGTKLLNNLENNVNGSCTSAAYINGYLNPFFTGIIKAGEALINNQLCFISTDGKAYPVSNTGQAINPDSFLVVAGNNYAVNTEIGFAYLRTITAVTLTAATNPNLTIPTFAKGDQLFLRCHMSNGLLYSDAVITTEVAPGYTWIALGYTHNATGLSFNTQGKEFFTLDANGKLTHIDGREIVQPAVPDENVFIAEFDVTPYADVLAAVNDNSKAVFCQFLGLMIPYISKDNDGTIHFGVVVEKQDEHAGVAEYMSYIFWVDTGFGWNYAIGRRKPFLDTTSETALTTNASESLMQTVKLHKVSKTGNYNDLLNKPTIPTEVFVVTYGTTTQAEIKAAAAAGQLPVCKYGDNLYVYAGESSTDYSQFTSILYDTAYRIYVKNTTWGSGSYEVYSKPSGGIPASDIASGVIPAAPVNADWNATEGLAKILNKPTIPAAPVNADWNASSGLAQILNKPTVPTTYAGSPTAGGFANKAVAIPFGEVVEGSTETALLATVDNFPDTLTDGVCAYVRNNMVSSASGFTLNINGTGAKPVYQTLADAGRVTTVFNAASTYLFIYNSTRVEGGCWDLYYGYNSNDNTIGYNLRTNTMTLPVTSACYRYRLLFTSADGTHFVPANSSSSTSATAKKSTTSTKIDPFGSIRYYSSTSAVSSGSRPGATALWEQYLVTLGYSFNRTGAALTLTAWKPVYIKCTPQADGSAIIEAETPYVQDLPTTADGKIYIYLGVATAATQVEVVFYHPVYYYDDNAIQLWTKPEPYNIRNNKMAMRIQSNGVCARYRLLFAGHDGTEFVAANESHSTSPDDKKTVTAFKIDPFGGIWYYSGTEEISWGNRPAATSLWRQHIITLGYSFNRTGSALSLSIQKQVYIKCTPQSDGSAVIDADTPYVQNLPTSADGKIYILLGYAVSATEVELILNHPVYCYKDDGIRPWIAEKTASNTVFSFSADGSNATLHGDASSFSSAFFVLLAPEKLSLLCYAVTDQSYQMTTYYARLSFTNFTTQETETNINKAVYHFDDGFTTLEYHYATNKFVLNGIEFIYNETTKNYETDQWPTS